MSAIFPKSEAAIENNLPTNNNKEITASKLRETLFAITSETAEQINNNSGGKIPLRLTATSDVKSATGNPAQCTFTVNDDYYKAFDVCNNATNYFFSYDISIDFTAGGARYLMNVHTLSPNVGSQQGKLYAFSYSSNCIIFNPQNRNGQATWSGVMG